MQSPSSSDMNQSQSGGAGEGLFENQQQISRGRKINLSN